MKMPWSSVTSMVFINSDNFKSDNGVHFYIDNFYVGWAQFDYHFRGTLTHNSNNYVEFLKDLSHGFGKRDIEVLRWRSNVLGGRTESI